MVGVAGNSIANLEKDGILPALLVFQFSRISKFLILIICEVILYSGHVHYIINNDVIIPVPSCSTLPQGNIL